MNIRKRLHRLLFGAESRLQEETYKDYMAEHARRQDLDTEVRALRGQVGKLTPRPARFDRYRAMDEDQLAEVLAGAGELPAVKAIMQMIDEKFQQASDAAGDPKLSDGETKFNLGGADWIVKLKQELQGALEQERGKETAQT